MKNSKSRFALGVASVAFVTGIASPASAACTVDGSTVTCSTDSTVAEVNAAMAAAGGSDVTLIVADDVDVIQPGGSVFPTQQGAVNIVNAGELGTDAVRVPVTYVGTANAATNTFDLNNSGTISGALNVFNVGGGASVVNGGLIGNGVSIQTAGPGPVSLVSTGAIDADGPTGVQIQTRGDALADIQGVVGTEATATTASDLKDVIVVSLQTVNLTPTTTVTTDGTATTTVTTDAVSSFNRVGSAAAVTIGVDGASGQVIVNGLGSASITVNGAIGSETDYQNANANSSSFDQNRTTVTTIDGADFSASDTTVRTAVGGEATIDVGATGSVSGNVNANGLAGAAVNVDGTVGDDAATAGVFANSNNFDQTTVSTNAAGGTLSNSTYDRITTSVGGLASISVGETGAVAGGVQANGVGGAEVAIDGSVGLGSAPSFANATSSGSVDAFAQQQSFDSATGESAYAQQSEFASNGGDATVTVSADGTIYGVANAFANADAAVANGGLITGGVSAVAQGSSSASTYDNASGPGAFAEFSTSEFSDTGGTATITNAAGGLIGEEPTAPVTVNASGDTAATVANSGRINGNVFVESSTFARIDMNSSSFVSTTAPTTLVVTTVETEASGHTETYVGGDATSNNAAGGLVTGIVNVSGTGSGTVTNNGAVIGTTVATSQATDRTFAEAGTDTSVFTPGADGGTANTHDYGYSYAEATSGGDVTGTYAGTNGAVQFAPFGGASDGSVSQNANGDSTAIVSGTIFGNYTGNATGYEYGEEYAEQFTRVLDADGDQRSYVDGYDYAKTNRQSDSSSTLAVNGGTITGNASLFATGSASAQLGNDAAIEGSLSVTAQGFGGYDYSESRERSFTYDEDGVFIGSSATFSRGEQDNANLGDVAVSIGKATVGGSVNLNGASGSNTFTLAEEGAVGGAVFQASTNSVYAYTETRVTDVTPTSTRTVTDYAQDNIAAGGDVTATVAGSIGNGTDNDPLEYGDVASTGGASLSLNTNAGDASATVTGQVRGGIQVIAVGDDTTSAFQQTTVNGVTTAYAQQNTSTATGGTATLVVDADDLDVPANFGNIVVSGRGGSTVTIGSDSTVLAATNGAFMQVGGYFSDTASSSTNAYTAGALTGQEETFSSTTVGGPASLVNDGRIGYDGGAGFYAATMRSCAW